MAKRKKPGDGEEAAEAQAPEAKAPPPAPAAARPAYLVLARKYRPQTFEDLIGQDAMVRTLRNAFETGRIAQGFMLTGVRGVGKTTTARILARAFNYKTAAVDRPSVELTELGQHCQAIMDSRHPDVVEMDAASNTGVDNVREIIESVRYHPVAARTKVFIIDEVHMLSKGAFNALLKTLEEPPPHVKFIFATTEIRKVPVTVLSRCQRFDLRRVEAGVLAGHFERIAGKEGIEIEAEALATIARVAEGSVRDGLSILDQAFATASGTVTAQTVRGMLGLADRGRIFDLLEAVLRGDGKAALMQLASLHKDGADPVELIGDLAEVVHGITRAKIAGVPGDTLSEEERTRSAALAGRLNVGLLSRAWQMLLKGIEEAGRSPDAAAAAEMLIVRLAYMAVLPSPDEVLKRINAGAARAPQAESRSAPPPEAEAYADPDDAPPLDDWAESLGEVTVARAPDFASFADLVGYIGREKRDLILKAELEDHVSLVRFDPPQIELHLLARAAPGLANDFKQKLDRWTGKRWGISLSREMGERPLGEVRREREKAEIEAALKVPAVQAALQHFPGAVVTGVVPIAAPEGEDSAHG
jgi:DNA polymerase-3 subunit gamma/tau